MKKIIVLGLALLMAVSCLGGCGKSNKQAASKDTLIVGFDSNFPPYGYKNDKGEYVGFDLDLAAEVAKRRGWELKLQPIDWNSKDMELNSGTINCIWNGFTISDENKDKYTWSKPYVNNSQVFVVKKDSGIKEFKDLAGKPVAVQTASSALEALESDENKELTASFSELVKVGDYNNAFMNLESGSVDAIAVDIGVAKYQIENRDNKYVILDQVLSPELYAIGFKLGNTELKDKVEKTLLEMVDDGTFDEIAKKWDLTESVILGK